jgi:Sortase and related acyltransferases
MSGKTFQTHMTIQRVRPEHSSAWERMRESLWPSTRGEHAGEIARFFEGHRADPAEVLIAFDETGQAIGLAELSIRSHAEGCHSGRVGYLEGWYVRPDARRQGVGAALVARAEEWALAQGCTEFASDCEVGNVVSATAHRALGFEEVVRSICFKKELSPKEAG